MSWKSKQKRLAQRKPAEITISMFTDDGEAAEALSAAQQAEREAGGRVLLDIATQRVADAEGNLEPVDPAVLAAHPIAVAAREATAAAEAAFRDTVVEVTFRALH